MCFEGYYMALHVHAAKSGSRNDKYLTSLKPWNEIRIYEKKRFRLIIVDKL